MATKGEELLEVHKDGLRWLGHGLRQAAGLKEYAFDEERDCQTALAMSLLLCDDCWWPKPLDSRLNKR